MDQEQQRRGTDKDFTSTVAFMARRSSRSFWSWFRNNHVDSISVLGVALWLTVRGFTWAFEFAADGMSGLSGADKALIIGAILTPAGLVTAALYKFYADLRAKANGYSNGAH